MIDDGTEEDIPEIHDDHDDDRDYHHALVGRNIKALYGNGWFTGTILWYNKMVIFEDETEDYMYVENIDGIEIILL